jgi:glycosyltransferase involved in cell wall biosynthesis
MLGEQPAPLLVLSANTAWNLAHFRLGLIEALLADGYRILAVAPDDGQWSQELRCLGCDFWSFDLDPAGVRPWREMIAIAALIRLLRRERPAAWLSWTIKPNIYGAIAARFARVRAYPNVSGLGTAFMRRGILNLVTTWLYRLAFQRCPAIFFQNPDDQHLFVEQRLVRAAQCRLLPGSGVDLGHFRPAPCPSNVRHFVLIARLLGDKGVREFVAAASIVRDRWPDARFTLVGAADAPNRTAIGADEVDAWVRKGVVEWQPPVQDIRPLVASAGWVVLPSYREGMPRTLLEALAMARPIVTTDVAGCRETVEDGRNGFLARCRDVGSLVEALSKAAAVDDDRWGAMARHSRALAERRFAIERVVAAYRSALAVA